ncbi:Single-stranded DNA-binding protein [bioreactor metagenome]|uniref:Single-stranded DNA-binding protein n=1 Tax=bioreactor metagenome TaxID=1076179 RepID=A0A644ZCB2_9ZZZZ
MNKVILVGRLATEVEVRYTQSGKAVASFNIAVSRYAGQGQKDSTDFIPIVAWEKLAEICGNNLTKGRRILVEGRLQIRTYETNDGQKRRIAEVIAQNIEFLESKSSGQASPADNMGESYPEEEIPF